MDRAVIRFSELGHMWSVHKFQMLGAGVTFLASRNRRSRDESDFSFPPLELEGLRPALASYLRIALHTSAAAAARRADGGSVPTRTMDPCRRDDDGSIVEPGGGLLL